ncbi:adenylate/guanylate cyclase domain-containing protein [Steroidobacter cummioxidans]|uniref:adenylate/guanylate cyclase domain-containing protein n=1 Tax=Steroidobacter cummioxidans TaxID=1803913 RepID=UPI00137A6883|nr:adenylate/guanylate cyclase domain-containing response regulator [Steroidobacter cummioxidans]
MSATLSATYRTLLVGSSETTRGLLDRLLDASDIVIDDMVEPDQVIASVARRAPDLIVLDVEAEAATTLARVCGVLKANPTTLLVPLVGLAKSAKQRLLAFEAGVDDFLTHQVRREEFLMRVRSLLKVSATRRQLAAEQLAEEVKRRELIRAAFRRYISPKLADQILASPELLDSMFAGTHKRTQVAVMFADMRGFTALSERLNPEQVVELLNEFFKLLTDITFEYEGTVFSMAGDSLLVGFGVPVAQEDGAERSILAAKLMLGKFAELAHRWTDRYGVETGLGIGINVGEVIAGNVGSPSYMNYTIIGDTVNVASRLGQRARAGEMLFSDAVKNLLDERGVDVGAMPLPSLVLRGRSSPIGIFCVPTNTTDRVDFRPN